MYILIGLLLLLIIAFMHRKEINTVINGRLTHEEISGYEDSVMINLEEIFEKNREELLNELKVEKEEIKKMLEEIEIKKTEIEEDKKIISDYLNNLDYKLNKYEEYKNVLGL